MFNLKEKKTALLFVPLFSETVFTRLSSLQPVECPIRIFNSHLLFYKVEH